MTERAPGNRKPSAGTGHKLRRILLTIAVVAALVYGGAVAYLISQETRLVFAAGRPLAASRPTEPFEQADLPRGDALKQFAFILRQSNDTKTAPWVLFLHGNRATVASRVNIVRYEQLRALHLNIVAPRISRLRRARRYPDRELSVSRCALRIRLPARQTRRPC